VFFVRVANKGVTLDAASTLADAGFKVSVFSVSCRELVRVANKELSGVGTGSRLQAGRAGQRRCDEGLGKTGMERRLSRESIRNGSMDYTVCQ
jgi:hypothetical protein